MKIQMRNKKVLSFLTLTAIVSQALVYPVYAQTSTSNGAQTAKLKVRSYFTGGENIMTYKKLRIYAITPDDRELLVLSVD